MAVMIESRERPIFVIGSLVAACCARVPRCPEPGESVQASGFVLEPGGKGFNVALAVHRLGLPVDGLFAVGDDALGGFMRTGFTRLGLPDGLIETVDAPTGAGVGLIQSEGENRIAVFPGANHGLSAEDVASRADRLRDSVLVFAQFEASDAPIEAAFATAREAGIVTMLNPSPYRPISPVILSNTDILVLNQSEAACLLAACNGAGDLDALAMMLAINGLQQLIVTRGPSGAAAWQDGKRLEHPGFAVDAVDSIGAGDAFAGGFIAALVRGMGVDEALAWGCAAGALTVQRLGLIDALPTMADLHAMIGGGEAVR